MKILGKETEKFRKNLARYTSVMKKEIAKGKREGMKMGYLLQKEGRLLGAAASRSAHKLEEQVKTVYVPAIQKEGARIRELASAKKKPSPRVGPKKSSSLKRGGKK